MLFWIAFAVVSALVTYFKKKWFYIFTKPVPILLLLSQLINHFSADRGPTFLFALYGLGWGLAGDIFLLKSNSVFFFMCGLIAFLIGHIYYALAFLTVDWTLPEHLALGMYAAGVVYLIFILSRAIRHERYNYMPAMAAYQGAITVMCWAAINFDHTLGTYLATIGAFLFMISDTLLAYEKFFKWDHPLVPFFCIGTYYAAQGFIVAAIMKQQKLSTVF